MSRIVKTKSYFSCRFCGNHLQEPILLPCGNTVCKFHSEEIAEEQCKFCQEIHIIPKNGFPVNDFAKKQLENQHESVNLIKFSKFNDSKKLIEELNTGLRDLELIQKDPQNYISNYFRELARQVDLRREVFINEIQEYSNELINNIDRFEKECMEKSTNIINVNNGIKNCKVKLDRLNGIFDLFEMDDNKLEEIMTQKQAREIQTMLKPLSEGFKFKLQGDKCYKFLATQSNYLKIDKVFGS